MSRKRSRSPSSDPDDDTPSCPICLCEIQDIKQRAVVAQCMHVFCVPCLQRWVSYKRFCPLCKGPINSYLYGIQSDNSYNECVLPAPLSSGGQHSRWEAADQQPAAPAAAAPGAAGGAPRVRLRSEAWYTWGPMGPSGGGRHWRRDNRHSQQQQQQQQQQRRRGQRRRSGASTSSNGSSSEGEEGQGGRAAGAVQPRPYYWRVQQRMLARDPHLPAAGVPPGPHNPAAAATAGRPPAPHGHMRQQVYQLGLWAQPPAPNPASITRNSSSSCNRSGMVGRVSQRSAEAWVDRELQVLLQDQDVMIIRAFVMGLVHSFGLQANAVVQEAAAQQQVMVAAAQAAAAAATTGSRQHGSQPQLQQTVAGPVASLQGFLFDKAAHFWHELCCYANAGYTMDTYDRLVKYSWPADPSSRPGSPQTGAARGAVEAARPGPGVRQDTAQGSSPADTPAAAATNEPAAAASHLQVSRRVSEQQRPASTDASGSPQPPDRPQAGVQQQAVHEGVDSGTAGLNSSRDAAAAGEPPSPRSGLGSGHFDSRQHSPHEAAAGRSPPPQQQQQQRRRGKGERKHKRKYKEDHKHRMRSREGSPEREASPQPRCSGRASDSSNRVRSSSPGATAAGNSVVSKADRPIEHTVQHRSRPDCYAAAAAAVGRRLTPVRGTAAVSHPSGGSLIVAAVMQQQPSVVDAAATGGSPGPSRLPLGAQPTSKSVGRVHRQTVAEQGQQQQQHRAHMAAADAGPSGCSSAAAEATSLQTQPAGQTDGSQQSHVDGVPTLRNAQPGGRVMRVSKAAMLARAEVIKASLLARKLQQHQST